jgi:hypothetical protein
MESARKPAAAPEQGAPSLPPLTLRDAREAVRMNAEDLPNPPQSQRRMLVKAATQLQWRYRLLLRLCVPFSVGLRARNRARRLWVACGHNDLTDFRGMRGV